MLGFYEVATGQICLCAGTNNHLSVCISTNNEHHCRKLGVFVVRPTERHPFLKAYCKFQLFLEDTFR